ncbi:MAG TPA: hypothetical protein VNK82_05885 [Terriglobales bacterium]|nr:hypothetical protein [Terriglobales bacterium]
MALVGVEKIAKALNVTRRRVNQLVHEGMPRAERGKYELGACMAWYIRYMQSAFERREMFSDDGSSADVRRQRARMLKASADLAEMELAEKRGELVPVEAFKRVMGNMIAVVRSQLLGLPGRVAHQLEGEPRHVIRKRLTDQVHVALTALSIPETYLQPGHCLHCGQAVPELKFSEGVSGAVEPSDDSKEDA